jgi:uncharacterized protein (DUF58 family)
VLLDVRRSTHDAASFEAAVSAAASIITANSARRDLVRLATTDGADSGFGAGSIHVQALLEHLAVIELSGGASLRAMLDLVKRDGQGALVVIVAMATGDELKAAAALRQRFGMVACVRVDAGTRQAAEPPGSGLSVIRVTAQVPFARAWDRAMAANRRGVPVGSVR